MMALTYTMDSSSSSTTTISTAGRFHTRLHHHLWPAQWWWCLSWDCLCGAERARFREEGRLGG